MSLFFLILCEMVSMDFLPIDVLSRWVHVGTAITLVGGSLFLRFVLLPAATSTLTEEEHDRLRASVIARWKRFVHGGIALFLLSGFYNYFRAMPLHKGDKLYHPLIGTKILLALAVFFIASALVGRSPTFAAWRAKPRPWLMTLIVLSAVIVGISGYCKVALKGTVQPTTANLKGDAASGAEH